eukprot:4984437-Prorocentrum_lima.AAC.1
MTSSLVGSEMCIRDRRHIDFLPDTSWIRRRLDTPSGEATEAARSPRDEAVSYTHLTLPTICSV